MKSEGKLYEVWIYDDGNGWWLNKRTTFRDAKMCEDAYGDEVRIVPVAALTADAWVTAEDGETA